MPAPPIFGMASGQDHNQTIQKLMQIERVPILRMKKEVGELEIRKKAWGEVRGRVRKLADKSRQLYSFIGPFTQKKVFSSDPGAITGSAAPSVQNADQQIKVLELATNHQIRTDRIDKNQELPAGKFEIKVGEESYTFNFSGGSINDLYDLLKSRAPENLLIQKTRVDENGVVLGLRSELSGKPGAITLKDPAGVLAKLGLLKEDPAAEKPEPIKFTEEKVTYYKERIPAQLATGEFKITKEGKRLEINGPAAVKIGGEIPAGSKVMFSYRLEELPAAVGDDDGRGSISSRLVKYGPEINSDVEDVHLEGYNIDRMLEFPGQKPKEPEGVKRKGSGLGFIAASSGEPGGEINFEKPTLFVETTVKADSSALYLFNEKKSSLIIEELRIIPNAGPDGKQLVTNDVTPARDARLEIDGVEVTRPSNRDLKDIIEGASLNLNRTTEQPVNVSIRADAKEITNQIQEWIDAYNELLKFCRENSRAGESMDLAKNRVEGEDMSKSFDSLRANSGIFFSDSTIRTLIYKMQLNTASAYPAPETDAFHVLSDIGISTGRPNQRWDEIKDGYLQLDSDKLEKALNISTTGVKELFSSDVNEDNRVDNGVAFNLVNTLNPFGQMTGGLIGTRIELLDQQIADNKDSIRRKELSLKVTEDKLRQKFGSMETAIQQSKATRNFLKQRIPGFSGQGGDGK